MGRRYRDPIRVWSGPDQGGPIGSVPVRFRWRWRTYVITEVLDRWIEAGQWWTTAGEGLRASGDTQSPVPAATAAATATAAVSAVVAATATATTTDRTIWRVEARAPGASGVFDLCERVPATGGRDQVWLLVAVVD